VTKVEALKQRLARIWSLIVGLKVTGTFFVSPQITVHYPRQTVRNMETFHGPVELVPRPDDPAKPRCIVCMQCVSACPSKCLSVVPKPQPRASAEGQEAHPKPAEAKGDKAAKKPAAKEPLKFMYDFTLCSLCGTCVETCPVGSLRFSHDAYLAGPDKAAFVYDLLARLAGQAAAGCGRAEDKGSARVDDRGAKGGV
jgi:NADH-quinone oxidoreductase subunit I